MANMTKQKVAKWKLQAVMQSPVCQICQYSMSNYLCKIVVLCISDSAWQKSYFPPHFHSNSHQKLTQPSYQLPFESVIKLMKTPAVLKKLINKVLDKLSEPVNKLSESITSAKSFLTWCLSKIGLMQN